MKKYLIAFSRLSSVPLKPFWLNLRCFTSCSIIRPIRVMTNEPTTQKVRYKTLGKYATQDEAKAALDSMVGAACPKI